MKVGDKVGFLPSNPYLWCDWPAKNCYGIIEKEDTYREGRWEVTVFIKATNKRHPSFHRGHSFRASDIVLLKWEQDDL